MAQGHHQIITKPRLYVSYPLYLYAMGGLDFVGGYNHSSPENTLSKEDIYNLISLDPSKSVTISGQQDVFYNLMPKHDMTDSEYMTSPQTHIPANFLFDTVNTYAMVLGSTTSSTPHAYPYGLDYNDSNNYGTPFENSTLTPFKMLGGSNWGDMIDEYVESEDIESIINYPPEYKGFSAWRLKYMPQMPEGPDYLGEVDSFLWEQLWTTWMENHISNGTYFTKHMGFTLEEGTYGSLLYGKFFDLPQNAELSQSVSFNYGRKQRKSISGKTLSSLQYDRPDEWASGEPFGLGSSKNNPYRRSGVRTWDVAFTSLEPKHLMSQNIMENSNGYEAQDNHSTINDNLNPVSSLYNSFNSVDFQNNVMKYTMGGHLPMVLCTDTNDTSPSNWAIVRIKQESLQITQKSPNLYSFKMTLEEQI